MSSLSGSLYFRKLLCLRWSVVFIICLIASVGFISLYSAGGGSFSPWLFPQLIRFGVGLALMLCIANVDPKFWWDKAYLIYLGCFLLLILVEVKGAIGMGAQRWINLGVIQIQPSELMKPALVLALSRYFGQVVNHHHKGLFAAIPPLVLIGLPAILVLRQPDLGTTLLLCSIGMILFFMAGVRTSLLLAGGVLSLGSIPFIWHFLREYQQNRVLTFLNPERDPLGTGYHIIQSKIALGSGGFFGRGYLKGTQSHLNFLPEKQTDFIFTMFSEEFGFLGAMILLGLYALLIFYGFIISFRADDLFGRFVAIGITSTLFIYVFVNVAMVTGLVPVVGIPLPFVSYGGSALLTLLMSFGFLLGIDLHRSKKKWKWKKSLK